MRRGRRDRARAKAVHDEGQHVAKGHGVASGTAAVVAVVVMAGMCEHKCEPDARLVQALVEAADGFCQEEEQAVSEPSLDLASLQLKPQ